MARLGAMMLVLAAAGCTEYPAPPVAQIAAAQVVRPVSFQDHLDRLGVPYQVPPKGKAILINVPAFELIAFKDGAPVMRSRVIVGTPWNRTPLIRTHASAVRFRPTWRPTPSMIRSGEHKDRLWPAGPRNPLGLAAIRLEPGLLVYLHDTNRRNLFERDKRALSHGCVRVERWDELIAWVLDMSLDEVHRLANGRRTFDMPTGHIPVRMGYFTRFPDDDGNPVTYADVYKRGRTVGAVRKPRTKTDPGAVTTEARAETAVPATG